MYEQEDARIEIGLVWGQLDGLVDQLLSNVKPWVIASRSIFQQRKLQTIAHWNMNTFYARKHSDK